MIGNKAPGDIGQYAGFTPQIITYASGTVTIDWTLGIKSRLVFGAGNIAVLDFEKPPLSGNLVLIVKQDSVGSRLISSYGSDIIQPVLPVLSTNPNGINILSYYYDSIDQKFYGIENLFV